MALKSEEVFWEWNVMERKNPSHTGAFLNSYDHRDFSPEEVAARESGQNAMDAGSKIKKVTRLVFQELRAEGENKDRILDLLKMKDSLAPRMKAFSASQRDSAFFKSLESFLSREPIRALLIRDYNTCGLGGALNRYEMDDHFSRLIYALNLDDKAGGDENSGGSYGLGKTAYAKSSTINTVIYHSVFKETESTNGAYRRLMGAGVYPRHEFKGRKYGGYAYIGQCQSKSKSQDASPFENEKAQRLWNSLGDAFGVDLDRSEKQHGTDVLILMDNLDWKALIRAIEDYYFPALHDNQLHVRFIDRNKKTTIPSVVKREDLRPFLDLYKKAGDGDAQRRRQETLWTGNMQRHQGYFIGSFAFQSIPPEEGEIDSDEGDSKTGNKNNRIAIMRGTGMVIDYVKMGGDQYEPAIGVFVAHKDIRDHLRIAENAAHSQWSEDSRRLAQQYPEIGKELVRRTNRVLMKNFRDFQKSLQPDVPKTRSDSGLLSRLLANILSGAKGNKDIKKTPNPVSLSLQSGGRSDEKSLWRLRIDDCENTPDEEFDLTLRPQISLAGDSKKIAIRHREFIVRDRATGTTLPDDEVKAGISRSFSKGKSLDFDIEIDNPGHKNYLIRCKCDAELRESQEKSND